MPDALYDVAAPKKPTNVSLNRDLLAKARGLGVNLSEALELKLIEILRAEEARRWKERHRGAFEDYNAFVEEHGVFSDGLRKF